jgi:hypothetical protein
MIFEPAKERFPCVTIRGKVGFTAGVGFARCGYTRCGCPKDFGGIYSQKLYGTGVTYIAPKRGGRNAPSRMRYYRPLNTAQEQANPMRGVFADAISAYHDLTSDERAILKEQAKKRGTSGYHLFISQWLQSHRA